MNSKAYQIRKEFKANDDIRDAGLTTPEDILRHDNILYGTDSQWQILDVYRPRNAAGKLPVLISVHGGAWVYGDKERYQYYCMNLAQKGFAVINYTYRLAPEHQFPAPMEDLNLVVTWMLEHAQQHQLDTNNVFAVGDSAGAHILSLYICICTNPEYATQYTIKSPIKSFRFNAIALNCGIYDIAQSDSSDMIAEYMPNRGSSEELELLAIPKHITSEFPPTFLMTSNEDFLRMQPAFMIREFEKFHIPYVYHMYGTGDNPLSHVFHCDMYSKDAAICNQDECDFFYRFINNHT